MRRVLSILVFCVLYVSTSIAQSANGTSSISTTKQVFLISEDDRAYGALVTATPTLLLDVCDSSMDKAYKKWVYMLADMEEYAAEKDFEIRGLKVWMNVFWNNDGSVQNIVYYPKPNSKHIDYSTFTSFLSDFAQNYKIDVTSEESFAHYGSASFPTFVSHMFPERKANK